jgi:hypothetical protein
MRVLVFDVPLNASGIRRAHRQGGIALLPLKGRHSSAVPLDPLRRFDLRLLDQPGDCHCPRQSAKNVQMVRNDTQAQRWAFDGLKRPNQIRLELTPQRVVSQKGLAIFGAVDHVHQDVRQRLRHAIVPMIAAKRGAGRLPGSSHLQPQRGEILEPRSERSAGLGILADQICVSKEAQRAETNPHCPRLPHVGSGQYALCRPLIRSPSLSVFRRSESEERHGPSDNLQRMRLSECGNRSAVGPSVSKKAPDPGSLTRSGR